ncbi:hypothetical protein PTKIN_Ptkin09bG0177300 [Pterospermum kingtungense]
MNLRYRDEHAIETGVKVRTGLEGPGLTVAQKMWCCIAMIGGQYIWTRFQSFSAFHRWGDSEQRPLARRAWGLMQRVEGLYKAASFGNLLLFLYTGRCCYYCLRTRCAATPSFQFHILSMRAFCFMEDSDSVELNALLRLCYQTLLKNFQGERHNWILIAGGALLSTLSIRLGYKLKQALDPKQQNNATTCLKENGASDRRRSSGFHLHLNMYSFTQEDDGCFNCHSGVESIREKHQANGQLLPGSEVALPLVTVPTSEFSKDNGVIKREVTQKLRQQLKRRDDMILEMEDQNRDLFESEREIQRPRKAIADHCVGHVSTNEKTSTVIAWPSDIDFNCFGIIFCILHKEEERRRRTPLNWKKNCTES